MSPISKKIWYNALLYIGKAGLRHWGARGIGVQGGPLIRRAQRIEIISFVIHFVNPFY